MADDASTDGTWKWMEKIAQDDPNVKIHRNKGPERLGHTILYDTLINDYATNDIVMIFHSDMYACPNMDKEVLKYLEPGIVVSATRIEPPLHPDGPEKMIIDFGIEPEEFKELELLKEVESLTYMHEHDYNFAKYTEGIFAPWAIYKSDFQSIEGHDPLFAPQSKEDSDIFNRFMLNGYKLIQTWTGYVYHMTCRGSRFKDGVKRNPDGQVFMENRETDEWLQQNHRSTRNFIRKWGHFVKHDEMMKPIIPPKYDICFDVDNCTLEILEALEPWCSKIYVEERDINIIDYITKEQKNTLYYLQSKVWYNDGEARLDNDIVVEFDASKLTNDNFQFLTQLPEILQNSGEVGEVMEYDIFEIIINSLKTYEKDLIICKR
jgi:hypothetical protein